MRLWGQSLVLYEVGTVAQAYNLRTQKVEAGIYVCVLEVQGYLQFHIEFGSSLRYVRPCLRKPDDFIIYNDF